MEEFMGGESLLAASSLVTPFYLHNMGKHPRNTNEWLAGKNSNHLFEDVYLLLKENGGFSS